MTESSTRGLDDLESIDRRFAALSHQTRRAILHVLHANSGTMTSGAIAARFECTWQTTSRHLRLLEEAGLIHISLRGRERMYELDTDRLRDQTIEFVNRFNPWRQDRSGCVAGSQRRISISRVPTRRATHAQRH